VLSVRYAIFAKLFLQMTVLVRVFFYFFHNDSPNISKLLPVIVSFSLRTLLDIRMDK
jgi:hypothetical protein